MACHLVALHSSNTMTVDAATVVLLFCYSELECIDVTVPVQSMVKNSQLVVPAGTQLVRELIASYRRDISRLQRILPPKM